MDEDLLLSVNSPQVQLKIIFYVMYCMLSLNRADLKKCVKPIKCVNMLLSVDVCCTEMTNQMDLIFNHD